MSFGSTCRLVGSGGCHLGGPGAGICCGGGRVWKWIGSVSAIRRIVTLCIAAPCYLGAARGRSPAHAVRHAVTGLAPNFSALPALSPEDGRYRGRFARLVGVRGFD